MTAIHQVDCGQNIQQGYSKMQSLDRQSKLLLNVWRRKKSGDLLQSLVECSSQPH